MTTVSAQISWESRMIEVLTFSCTEGLEAVRNFCEDIAKKSGAKISCEVEGNQIVVQTERKYYVEVLEAAKHNIIRGFGRDAAAIQAVHYNGKGNYAVLEDYAIIAQVSGGNVEEIQQLCETVRNDVDGHVDDIIVKEYKGNLVILVLNGEDVYNSRVKKQLHTLSGKAEAIFDRI
ncbi:hypothetical protein D3C76_1308000 [compost metagenome]